MTFLFSPYILKEYRNRLLAFGDGLTVVSPPKLRKQLRDTIRNSLKRYKTP